MNTSPISAEHPFKPNVGAKDDSEPDNNAKRCGRVRNCYHDERAHHHDAVGGLN